MHYRVDLYVDAFLNLGYTRRRHSHDFATPLIIKTTKTLVTTSINKDRIQKLLSFYCKEQRSALLEHNYNFHRQRPLDRHSTPRHHTTKRLSPASIHINTATMGWIDRIPRAGNLHIGGLYALYQPNIVKAAGVTHVLSVIDFDFYELKDSSDYLKSQNYVHLVIPIEDDPNEDLLQHFEQTSSFIDDALQGGGGVFVHCAMGKSRSAATVVAYLMWKFGYGRDDALSQVCEGRPVCSPTPGFMEQLSVFQQMLLQENEGKKQQLYDDWLRNRFLGFSHEWEARAMKAKL
jgi:dual specificity phosphatase 12